jgi:hypothetical protein
VIIQRWQDETGEAAVLDGEDGSFTDIAALRGQTALQGGFTA